MKVYFEAGANDGVFQSRTLKYKDDPEWEGFLIEPDPRCLDALLDNRSGDRAYIFDRALVSLEQFEKSEVVTLHQHHHSAMNFVHGCDPRGESGSPIEVSASTITKIVLEAGFDTIDELYLDVEGYELEALKGIDPNKILVLWAEIELHRHDRSDAAQEYWDIVNHMSTLGLYRIDTNTSEGHPKLIFRHHSLS